MRAVVRVIDRYLPGLGVVESDSQGAILEGLVWLNNCPSARGLVEHKKTAHAYYQQEQHQQRHCSATYALPLARFSWLNWGGGTGPGCIRWRGRGGRPGRIWRRERRRALSERIGRCRRWALLCTLHFGPERGIAW